MGGPRLEAERLSEDWMCDGDWYAVASAVGEGATDCTTSGGAFAAMGAGVDLPDGYSGHFILPLWKAGAASVDLALAASIMAQRCLPSRRQQGGSFTSGWANISGVISGELRTANSIAAHNWRTFS